MRLCTVENCERKHRAKGYCQIHYQQIRKYGEIKVNSPRQHNSGNGKLTEENSPEAAALVFDRMTEPGAKQVQAVKDSGLPQKTVSAIIRRMETRHLTTTHEVRERKAEELLPLIQEKLFDSLEYMDEVAFSEASLKDLGIFHGVMTDKLLLHQGKPTQIMTIDDRREMKELLPDLLREVRSRGLVIEAEVIKEGE